MCKLAMSFWIFQFSFFQIKNGKSFEGRAIFQDIEYQLQKNIVHHLIPYSFL